MEWLEGHIQRVLWSSEDSGWAVIRLATGPDEAVTAVGTLATAVQDGEGAFLSLEGNWEAHPVHGRQFRARGFLLGGPKTLHGMTLYLASAGVKGVGPALAARIVDHFGERTPAVIASEPHRLTEVDGIGAARAEAICEKWVSDEQGRALTMTLRGLGLSARLVERIRRRYGEQASMVVHQQPYRLGQEIRGVGFKTADALARQVGVPEDAPERVQAAVAHCLAEDTGDGHCYAPRSHLRQAVAQLGVPVSGLDAAVQDCEAAGVAIVERGDTPEQDRIWSAESYRCESQVAQDLAARAQVAREPVEDAVIEAAERWERVTLDPDQRAAVKMALSRGVSVITGGPGTGKTTLVKVLVRVARHLGLDLQLAAPTGRASRRLAEATGASASTIHRLLEYNPGEGGFGRDFGNPLDAEGLVLDEVSMVDIQLMSGLLDACPWPPEGFTLVFVGDADQLPSVGPGQVLRDIIASGVVPVARLQTVHRQAADSGIVDAAQSVLAGSVPQSGERSGRSDVFLLHRESAEAARDTLLKVVAERLPDNGFDPVEDVQVLTPMRRGVLGTHQLNAALQERLNPSGEEWVHREIRWRVGDRVICIRNRYDVEVFNGDIGRILKVSPQGLEVAFDGRVVAWGRDDMGLLDLAYAITVHKSQGSEYPAVVLALHRVHGLMLRRKLFYTALTRGKRFACVVGHAGGWRRAVEQASEPPRFTRLAQRLRRAADDEVVDIELIEP